MTASAVEPLQISREQARRFLATYHLTPSDIPGVIERLGTVQYDPLNPLGRNPDLVFQARVAEYRVDDWQTSAYERRQMYDAWDKQACLIPIEDWPMRAVAREHYHSWHDREVLEAYPEAVELALAEIDARGPLSSLEFEDRTGELPSHPWYGSTRIKRILRALWARSIVLTHHRTAGRHYYDRPERVIPSYLFNAPPVLDEATYHRWIVARRHQAVGLLRPQAEAAVWSACGDSASRRHALAELVEQGELVPVLVGAEKRLYHVPQSALRLLDTTSSDRMVFLAPLDSLLWDRKALAHLFDFTYVWEVYKPLDQRIWGYYVLPVFFRDRFVGRIDSRLEGRTWKVARWWWEPDIQLNVELIDALRAAASAFLAYLRADSVQLDEGLDPIVRDALSSAG